MNRSSLVRRLDESLRQAWETLRSHKMRSALVILGVGIGVTTLMLTVTILLGLKGKISQDIRSSDNTVIYLSKVDILVGGDPKKYAHRPEINPGEQATVRGGPAVENRHSATAEEVPHLGLCPGGIVERVVEAMDVDEHVLVLRHREAPTTSISVTLTIRMRV